MHGLFPLSMLISSPKDSTKCHSYATIEWLSFSCPLQGEYICSFCRPYLDVAYVTSYIKIKIHVYIRRKPFTSTKRIFRYTYDLFVRYTFSIADKEKKG
jgi:hypothetical protein